MVRVEDVNTVRDYLTQALERQDSGHSCMNELVRCLEVVGRMQAALANVHPFKISKDLFDLDGVPTQREWRVWSATHGILPVIRAYTRLNPHWILSGATTPRMWEFVSRNFPAMNPQAMYGDLIVCLGPQPARGFCEFLARYKKAVEDYTSASPIPTAPAELWAISAHIGERARSAMEDQLDGIVAEAGQLPWEYAVAAISDAAIINKAVINCPAMKNFIMTNKQQFLSLPSDF